MRAAVVSAVLLGRVAGADLRARPQVAPAASRAFGSRSAHGKQWPGDRSGAVGVTCPGRRVSPARAGVSGPLGFPNKQQNEQQAPPRPQPPPGYAWEEEEEDLDDEADLWRTPMRPWKEFTKDLGLPPSPEAMQQRIRLNVFYYTSNYVVIMCLVTLVLSLRWQTVCVGIGMSFLASVLGSEFWLAQLGPMIKRVTGKTVSVFTNLETGLKQVLVTKPNKTKETGSRLFYVSEEKVVYKFNQRTAVIFLWCWSSFLLLQELFGTVIVGIIASVVGPALCAVHASLRKPGLGSSVSGLGNVQSREELGQNLRTIWDVARGKNEKN